MRLLPQVVAPKPQRRIGVTDSGQRDPAGDQSLHSPPGEVVFLTAAFEYLVPQPTHLMPKSRNLPPVAGYSVVADVPCYHGPE